MTTPSTTTDTPECMRAKDGMEQIQSMMDEAVSNPGLELNTVELVAKLIKERDAARAELERVKDGQFAIVTERNRALEELAQLCAELAAAREENKRLRKTVREEWDGVAADKILTDVEALTARAVEAERRLAVICEFWISGNYEPNGMDDLVRATIGESK